MLLKNPKVSALEDQTKDFTVVSQEDPTEVAQEDLVASKDLTVVAQEDHLEDNSEDHTDLTEDHTEDLDAISLEAHTLDHMEDAQEDLVDSKVTLLRT